MAEIQLGVVEARISKSEFYALQSRQFVDDTFDGSLPAFIAAFTKHKKLTAEEAEEIRRMTDGAKEE